MGRRHRHLNRIHCGAVIDLDARFITGYSGGANMGTWINRGISAFNFPRIGTASQVTYELNAQGGQPCVRLGSAVAQDHFRISAINPRSYGYDQQSTVVAACRTTKATSTNRLLYDFVSSASTSYMSLYAQFTDNAMYYDHGVAGGSFRISGAVATSSNPQVYCGVAGISSSSMRRNGVQLISGSMGSSVANANHRFNLGGGEDNVNKYVGDIYAFVHAPFANIPVARRMEQSVAYSFKLST